ncbi:hydrogenase HycE [Dehalogenimonas sp. WBC-2]|nr:hydrogenase HycE [Dehalogenimonas sp. WBC-2]
MDNLTKIVEQQLKRKGFDGRSRKGPYGEEYLAISVVAMVEAVQVLKKTAGVVLIGLWAVENFGMPGFTLFYCFERRGTATLLLLEVHLVDNRALSIARDFPVANYFQREVTDGFGLQFDGAFDNRRLLLHESYPDNFHPLRKSFDGHAIEPVNVTPEREYCFRQFQGEGIYQVPVGPVHAGIIESGHFRFSVIGETVFNLEIRHFWKYRGLEKLAENKKPDQVIKLAETISGDESAANACAFAMAVEYISGVSVPRRAWKLRTVLLELERIYSHLGDLGGMAVDVAYPVGAAPFYILREQVLRWNAALTGSRFLKGVIIPGGLERDIPDVKLKELLVYIEEFKIPFDEALKGIYDSAWVIDRLETTGVVSPTLIPALNLTGPTARASGACIDTRIDHPYGIYGEIKPEIITDGDGDVLSRFKVKAGEIGDSLRLICDAVNIEADEPVKAVCQPKDGYAITLIEAARGQSVQWVYIKDGLIDRWKIRTASFCNWLAIEHAVIGNIVPDFPVINKSLNLSYAGNDL